VGLSYSRGHNSAGIGSVFNPSNLSPTYTARTRRFAGSPLRRAFTIRCSSAPSFSGATAISFRSSTPFQTQHAFGMYSSADYRVNRRWTVGGRYDRSGHATNANLTDTGFSGILTYWPSEFSQIRTQYRYGISGMTESALYQRERIAVPVSFRDGRARRASVLASVLSWKPRLRDA